MTICLFRSPLASRLQAFLDMRKALGRKGTADYKILTYLDRFMMGTLKPGETITRKITENWIKNMEHLSVGTRINRISVLRQFCCYLSYFDGRTCLIHRSALPRRTRPAPYIYTHREIRSILAAAKRIGPAGSFRPVVVSTLIGLLYATGLRVGEALKLTLGDVDIKRQVLVIRQTKFRKSRYVPFSPSTAKILSNFLRQRQAAGFSTASTTPVFVNPEGRAYGRDRICGLFLEIVRAIGLRGPTGERGPRLHDLRHTFAVQRLLTWYREGANLSAKLPLLTTYLGHTTVSCTEVYLQATAELLEEAGKRFYNHCAIPQHKKEATHVS